VRSAPRLPVVLTREEIRAALERLNGVPRLIALLLYGSGLRVLECARLRVRDIDFASNQIVVRAGKGDRDCVTTLPAAVKPDLARHLESVRRQYKRDLRCGAGTTCTRRCSARHPGRRSPSRHRQTRDLSHLPPLVRDPSA
jgi:integrase